MKRLLFIAALAIYALRLNAQINLEHTHNGQLQPILIDGAVSYYYDIMDNSNNITIYDNNLNIFKNINITSPSEYNLLSKSITTSANYEILIIATFNNSNTSNLNEKTIDRIYDFDGNIIKDFGTSYSSSIIFYFDKIIRYKTTIDNNNNISFLTEIYSNPYATCLNETNNNNIALPFPNPANNIIILPYNLNSGNSEMFIHDANGRLIEKKSIDSSSNNILLDIEGYMPGLYLYSVNGITQKFIVR